MSSKHNQNEFIFNVNTGFPAKNASKIDTHPDSETSVFNEHQLHLINQMMTFHIQQKLDEVQIEFQKEKESEYQRGIKAGFQQSQQQLQAQVNQSVKILNQLTANLSMQYDKISEEQEQDILNFVITMARKVIDTEIELNPEVILNVLKNALNLLNEREELKILVNPKDWLTVKENITKLNLRIDLPKQIEIVNSPNISPGGCRLEFKSGSIDADIETQFTEIKRKLLKYAE